MDARHEFKPGLRVSRPTVRLSQSERKVTHSYYTVPVESVDGRRILFYEFDRQQVDRRRIETLEGRLMVADADGSNARSLVSLKGDPTQGALGQWAGDGPCVAAKALYGEQYWVVIDTASGDSWRGPENMREVSPEGTELFIQPGEGVHLELPEGKSLSPEEVSCYTMDFRTREVKTRISVADIIAAMPDAEVARRQHLCIKQPLFSPCGRHLMFVVSNAWYLIHRPESEPYRHDICTAHRDGTHLRWHGPIQVHPSWLPGGDAVMAVAAGADGISRFMIYPVDGSPPHPLPYEGASGHPSLHPGGKPLVVSDFYGAPEPGYVTLRLMNTDTGRDVDLAVAAFSDYSAESGTHMHPTWSRDGTAIYYDSAHHGYSQLYRVDVSDLVP